MGNRELAEELVDEKPSRAVVYAVLAVCDLLDDVVWELRRQNNA